MCLCDWLLGVFHWNVLQAWALTGLQGWHHHCSAASRSTVTDRNIVRNYKENTLPAELCFTKSFSSTFKYVSSLTSLITKFIQYYFLIIGLFDNDKNGKHDCLRQLLIDFGSLKTFKKRQKIAYLQNEMWKNCFDDRLLLIYNYWAPKLKSDFWMSEQSYYMPCGFGIWGCALFFSSDYMTVWSYVMQFFSERNSSLFWFTN